uniref:tyrosine-protein kinase SYK-like n=1 Tax=Myxine glutinosa TaxID=7769 RepID=UPI00358E3001
MEKNEAENMPCYFGYLKRKEAKRFLRLAGATDGLYLLRSSATQLGTYVISITHHRKIHNYEINYQKDQGYSINDYGSHMALNKLIEYHMLLADGLCCPLRQACPKPSGFYLPPAPLYEMYRRATLEHVHKKHKLRGKDLHQYVDEHYDELLPEVIPRLHEGMAWFHRRISREDAEHRLLNVKHTSGLFLVRERDFGLYAISLLHKHKVLHYALVNEGGKIFLSCNDRRSSRKFDSICQMVEFYSDNKEQLVTRLKVPCVAPELRRYSEEPNGVSSSSHTWPRLPFSLSTLRYRGKMVAESNPPQDIFPVLWDNLYMVNKDARPSETPVYNSIYADPEELRDRRLELDRNRLRLDQNGELGSGNFGSVLRGIYKFTKKDMAVAVKVLKAVEDPEARRAELLQEAEFMAQLDHPFIVRIVGICDAEALMLVMEVASLGPLHTYLREHKGTMSQNHLIELVHQVSDGMSYLEERRFVHRDLAARNVLLVSERYAKISDFGLSKVLMEDQTYLRDKTQQKLPLKWYALESVLQQKFSSKGDVWSFGITVWETLSYGDKPYKGMRAPEVVKFLQSGQRLEKPTGCPETIYQLMLRCWEIDMNKRPTFKEIERHLSHYLTMAMQT